MTKLQRGKLFVAGLLVAAAGCASQGQGVVLKDRHGWPIPTYAFEDTYCYDQQREIRLTARQALRLHREDDVVCGFASNRGVYYDQDRAVRAQATQPQPVRQPAATSSATETAGSVVR